MIRTARKSRPLSIRQRRQRANGIKTAVAGLVGVVFGLPLALIMGVFMGEALANNTILTDAIRAAIVEPVYELETYDDQGNAFISDFNLTEADCDQAASDITETGHDATCMLVK